MNTIYGFTVNDISGKPVSLESYKGKVLLIVNTASRCGFTPQYRELESLYRQFKERGLVVLGFPCNQFGRQEPGDSREIAAFCDANYQISFPMFEKIDVNGSRAHPLYQFLKSEARGVLGSKAVKWNFTKFLIDANGHVFKRYAPLVTPNTIRKDIERLLESQ
ncbi:glutathione peroxidase [Methylomonas sp. MgM2]